MTTETPARLAISIAAVTLSDIFTTEPFAPPRLKLILSAPSLTASSIALAYKAAPVVAFISEKTRMNMTCASGATPYINCSATGLLGFPVAILVTCIP